MSDEGQESLATRDRPTLPPIRMLFGDELALPARPLATSTRSDLTSQSQPSSSRQLYDNPPLQQPRLASARHSSALETSSRIRTSYISSPDQPPGLSVARQLSGDGRQMTVPEAIHRSRSWSDTALTAHSTSSPMHRSAEIQVQFPHFQQPLLREAARNQAMNPYPPDNPSIDNHPTIHPPHIIGSSHDISGNLAPRYECGYCSKSFARPSSLKIHINSHTGERPFICPVDGCAKTFSVLSNMRRHARTAHRAADPVTCNEATSVTILAQAEQDVDDDYEIYQEDDQHVSKPE